MKASPKPKLPPYVVLKKNGEWHVRIGFATSDRDRKGRIVYEQVTRKVEPQTAERAAEIVRFLKHQYHSEKHQVQVPAVSTAGEYLESYLAFKERSVTERTYKYYLHLFEKHLKPSTLASMPVDAIDALAVQRFYDAFARSGNSATMVRKVHVLLSMAFRQAVRWDIIRSNPCDGVMLPRVKRVESSAMSRYEAKRLLEAAARDDRFIIFEAALETGLRPQEVIGLSWGDIDLARRKISVAQAVIEDFDGGGSSIGELKTKASYRTIGFSPRLKERLLRQRKIVDAMAGDARAGADAPVLLEHKKAQGANYRRRSVHRSVSKERLADLARFDLVFPASNGRPRSLRNLNRRDFRELLELAGIDPKKYRFASLRHTCLTFLADHLNPKRLQKFAGHAEYATTFRYYLHTDEDATYEASDILAKLLHFPDQNGIE